MELSPAHYDRRASPSRSSVRMSQHAAQPRYDLCHEDSSAYSRVDLGCDFLRFHRDSGFRPGWELGTRTRRLAGATRSRPSQARQLAFAYWPGMAPAGRQYFWDFGG